MPVKVPFANNINAHKIVVNCYTKRQFEEYVVKPLDSLCTVDDNGKDYNTVFYKIKSKTDSYTQMVLKVKVAVRPFPNDKIVTKDQVNKVKKILDEYSDNSSPNKKDVVHLVSTLLASATTFVDQTKSFLSMTQEQWDNTITRDIVCYMQALTDNADLKPFKDALKKAAIALTRKPSDEVQKESGVSLMNKYK